MNKHAPSQCRYWRQGTCKLGDSCRFLHDGARPTVPSTSGGAGSGTSGANAHLGGSGSLKTSGALRVSGATSMNSDASSNASGTMNSSLNASGASSLTSSGAINEFGEGLTSTAPQDRTGRRPFLKVVVLYASDSRVLRYAKEVQTQFLDVGVDVYLQIDLADASLSAASTGVTSSTSSMGMTSTSASSAGVGGSSVGGKDGEIKTENLAEIITSSTNADFLIVIGDRNMKNQSCQVKKRGKLVEMEVDDMIRAIWNEWAPHQVDFEDLDPRLPLASAIEQMSTTQLYIILQRYPPQVNFEEALKRAKEAGDEVKNFGKSASNSQAKGGSGSGGGAKKQAALPSLMTSSLLSGSNTVIFDEKQSAKFQTAQKHLVRIHKQALSLRAYLMDLPESKTEETFVINQDQFGHHVGPDYRPQQALAGQISNPLRSRLLDLVAQTIKATESIGSELASLGAPIWTGYIAQMSGGLDGDSGSLASSSQLSTSSYDSTGSFSTNNTGASSIGGGVGLANSNHNMGMHNLGAFSSGSHASGYGGPSSLLDSHYDGNDAQYGAGNSVPVPSANEWSCTYCTSFNELHLKECKVCGNARVTNTHGDDESWETAGEKKARKKREQQMLQMQQQQQLQMQQQQHQMQTTVTEPAIATSNAINTAPNSNAQNARSNAPGVPQILTKQTAAASATTSTHNAASNTAPQPQHHQQQQTSNVATSTSIPSFATAVSAPGTTTNITNASHSTASSISGSATSAPAANTVPSNLSAAPASTPAAISGSAAQVASHANSGNTSTVHHGKKKLLDPIPGLAAAKQAAKATPTKESAKSASAGSSTYTSPGSTYSSIVSGGGASSSAAAEGSNPLAQAFPPLGGHATPYNTPHPPLHLHNVNLNGVPSNSAANVGEHKSALNEIFGSSVHSGSPAATQGATVAASTSTHSASNATANAQVSGPLAANATNYGAIAPGPGPAGAAGGVPYFYPNFNGSTELPYLMPFPPTSGAAVPATQGSKQFDASMTDLFERWKQPNGASAVQASSNATVAPSANAANANVSNASAWGAAGNKGGGSAAPAAPTVLRTPTKQQPAMSQGANAHVPHTPTFTTPFKGNAGMPSSPASSRYGPAPSPMHLSTQNTHHHHHHQPQQQQQPTHLNPYLSQVQAPIMAHHLEEFSQAEPKIGVKTPCWYCGEEATLECNLCPKVGLETFFCSGQHQAYVWKFHVRTCHPVSPTLAASFEKNSYHVAPAPQPSFGYEPFVSSHLRRESNNNNNNNNNYIPRYSSPSGRQKYS